MMIESLYSSGTKTATTMISFLRAHKRVITFTLVALCAFWLTPSWSEAGPFYFVLAFVLFLMLIGGQLFWIGRIVGLGERFIPGKPRAETQKNAPSGGNGRAPGSVTVRLLTSKTHP
jgi:hypothetical protein